MISKVSENNKDLIKARLEEISLAVYNNKTSISSLESYYANITKIAPLTTNFKNAPYKYFLMPIDEPVFEIDANTRNIAVPPHFSKYGVGVHGDHMAEVLYFRINKYFDYQDLFDVDKIIINWQFRPANMSRNAELETHTSQALAPDDTYEPGYILFGWVITEDMTPSKGVLSFSVSFVKNAGEDYKYVLNTMIASVAINDSIALENPRILDSLEAPVFERLVNSAYTPANSTPLVTPSFRTAPVERMIDGKKTYEYKGLPATENFFINPDTGIEEDEITLSVIGYAPDEGVIEYRWDGTPANPNSEIFRDNPGNTTYVETLDTVAQENVTYYIKIENEFHALPYDDQNGTVITLADAFNKAKNITVYEPGNFITVTEGGSYDVRMQSWKTVTNDSEHVGEGYEPSFTAVSGEMKSQNCVIPMAAVPSVTLQVDGQVSFDDIQKFENGNLIKLEDVVPAGGAEGAKYTFIDSEATPANVTPPQVLAAIGIDKNKVWRRDYHDDGTFTDSGIKGVTEDSTIGAIALVMAAEGAEIPNANDIEASNFKVKDSANGIDYSINAEGGTLPVSSETAVTEGIYQVYAINRRNHTFNVSDASNPPIYLSKVAPIVSGINLVAKKVKSERQDIEVLNNNIAQLNEDEGESIPLYKDVTSRDFVLTIPKQPEDVQLFVEVVEIDPESDTIIPLTDEQETPPNVYYPLETSEDNNSSTSLKYNITIAEQGRFVVRTITTYHGTQRVTITAPFSVSSIR